MSPETILFTALAVFGGVLVAGGLGWLALDARDRRRQRRNEVFDLGEHVEIDAAGARRAAAERAEAARLATEAAITHAAAADRAWTAAHGTYDRRAYVIAGVARTLARASKGGDALQNAANTNAAASRQLIDDHWHPPGELNDDPERRPAPDQWARFDRASKTLAAVGSTTVSTLAEVAAAHHELAAAANELAEHLERIALTGKNSPIICSFCGLATYQVTRLIAGPGVSICDQCIDLCNEIITEET
jgi:hypothetical protein